jgi:hypothetical protein
VSGRFASKMPSSAHPSMISPEALSDAANRPTAVDAPVSSHHVLTVVDSLLAPSSTSDGVNDADATVCTSGPCAR